MVTSRYLHLPGVTCELQKPPSILAYIKSAYTFSLVFGVFLTMAGLYPTSTAVTAWIALNCAGSTKCAVGIGAMMSFSQLGGVSDLYIFLFLHD